MKRNEMQEGFVMTTAAEAVTPAGAGVLVRIRTSVSVIRSSRCQCTGQVGVGGGCAQSLELVMILAVWWLGVRRLKGRLRAVGHATGAGVDDRGGSARWRSRSRHCGHHAK